MPRRHRRAEERPEPIRRRPSDAPISLQFPGYDIRQVTGDKDYRCPGCDHVVIGGRQHLVVVPQDDVDARRHWHTGCWQIELNRLRGRRG